MWGTAKQCSGISTFLFAGNHNNILGDAQEADQEAINTGQLRGLILLHDNAQSHTAQMILHKLNHIDYETLAYPSYSPGQSSINFHFFNHLNNFSQQRRFLLDTRTLDSYHVCINNTVFYWQKCIDFIA